MDPKVLYRWVKGYDWSNPWAAANQVLACATALLAQRDWFGASDVDRIMEHGMYPALEELLDEKGRFLGHTVRGRSAQRAFRYDPRHTNLL